MWTVIRREFGRTAEPRQLRSMKDASLLEYVGNPAITSLQRTQQRALKHKASERPDTDEKHIGLRMSVVTENLVFQEYVTE